MNQQWACWVDNQKILHGSSCEDLAINFFSNIYQSTKLYLSMVCRTPFMAPLWFLGSWFEKIQVYNIFKKVFMI